MPRQRLRADLVRKIAALVGFAAAFLGIGWSAYWYIAQRTALRALNAALAAEQREGRTWRCDTMSSGGYPFAVQIDCEGLTTLAETSDGTIEAHARKARVRAPLYTPKLVTVDLTAPGEISIGQSNLRIALDWNSLEISTRGLPDRLDRISIVGARADLATSVGGVAAPPAKIAAFEAHARRAAGAPGSTYNLAVSLAGLDAKPLDAIIGGVDPAVFAAFGSVNQVDRATVGSFAERVELWRAAGGRLTVNVASLIKGSFAAQAEGSLGIDQSRRIDGKLDLRIRNASIPLANLGGLLGIPGLPVAAIAGSLLGAKRDGDETRLGVSFENGQLGVGPLKNLATLPPLY